MKNSFVALLTAVALVFLSYTFAMGAESWNSDTENDLTKSSVSIFSLGNGGMGRCSGVLINNNQGLSSVLTAKHCIGTYEETYVDGNLVNLIIASHNDDLALLLVKGTIKNKVPAKLASLNVESGPVYTVGYPDGNPHIKYGTLSIKTQDWEFYNMEAEPGFSGGGVFNENQELIGILWGGLSFEETAIIEPIKDIRAFLREIGVYTKWLNL
jgi:V8-like Glu-specific endopeptidase